MIKIKKTNQPFYGLYEYSFRFRVTDISSFRPFQGNPSVTLDELKKSITEKYISRRSRIDAWSVSFAIMPKASNLSKSVQQAQAREIADLMSLLDILYPYKGNIKLSLSGDYAYLFTNDISLIEKIAKEPYVMYGIITQANVVCDSGSIAIRNNPYKYRTFIQELRIEKQEKQNIRNVLNNQENLKLSGAFKYWLSHDLKWSRRHFFFDHNDDKLQLLLSLVNPKLIRKTLSIINK